MTARATAFDARAILFWAFAAILVWAPIPLGSNRPWAWMLLEVALYLLTAGWIVAWAIGLVEATDPVRKAWPAWALLGAWLLLQVLAIVPMPPSWVAVLSPESARAHALVRTLGVEPGAITLSIDPDASRISLFRTVAYGCVFFLALALLDRR